MLTSSWNTVSFIFCNSLKFSDVNSVTSMRFCCLAMVDLVCQPLYFIFLQQMGGHF